MKALRVFFDGDCPLCRKDIAFIRFLDRKRHIGFVDISAPEFDPSQWQVTQEALMGTLHGRTADGTWIYGVEVFRQMYTAVGFGWLVSLSRLPLIDPTLRALYRVFARNRLRLTGRCEAQCSVPSVRRSD